MTPRTDEGGARSSRSAPKGVRRIAAAPAPPPPRIAPVAGLTSFGESLWGDVVDHLERKGLLSMADACALERYVRAEELVRRFRDEWEREGHPVYGQGGATGRAKVVHPLIVATQNAEAAAQRYAADLGLTPASRLRLGVDKPDQPSLFDTPNSGDHAPALARVSSVARPGA